MFIFKILSQSEWNEAQKAGLFSGSFVDKKDGFIHFSNAEQVQTTLEKHFAGQTELMLLGVDEKSLGEHLKWEVSRGGALFPHLYAPLAVDQVSFVAEITTDDIGNHVLPKLPDG
ncbi:MAG: DUF952 domain-containing protein [Planctomycetota bacterium]